MLLGPLDRCRRGSTLFRFTTERLRDFIDSSHPHIRIDEQLGFAEQAEVYRIMGSNAESVERLARILYDHYDRKGDSRNSVIFNNLVAEWSAIQAKGQETEQGRMI